MLLEFILRTHSCKPKRIVRAYKKCLMVYRVTLGAENVVTIKSVI